MECLVCLLDTTISPIKTDEPIKMPFGLWTRVGQTNHVLGGGSRSPQGKGQFGGTGPTPLQNIWRDSCTETAEPIDMQFEMKT